MTIKTARLGFWSSFLFGACCTILQADPGRLRARILDADSSKPLTARMYLMQGEEVLLPQGFAFYDRRGEKHVLVPPTFEIPLDPGAYRVRIEKGKEYLPLEESLSITEGQATERTFRLKRWINMARKGWYSADLHVHRPPEVMAETLLAEDLNFAPVITVHHWHQWDSLKRAPPALDPLVWVDPEHVYLANAYEIERIVEGPGAVILFGSNLTLDFDGHELFPPASILTRRARTQGGHVDGDKLFWLDVPVNVALGELDFIQVANNHFFPRSVDSDLRRWASLKPGPGFEGDKGFALWNMDLYYRLLNCGFSLPVSGGSACGVKPLPVGYNRVYAKLRGAFSYERFINALKSGISFSTNGPMLDLKVNGKGPGSRIEFSTSREMRIEVTAQVASELESVEIVVNGQVVESLPGNGQATLSLKKKWRFQGSSWVAARAFEKSDKTVVFAQSSPVYLLKDGKPALVRADLQYWLDRVDELIARTRNQQGFKDELQRQDTLAVYERARKVYVDLLALSSP
ncbi:MAG: CehA/McbA family metallohydrolase [Acidobacteriota bacterium]